MEEPGYEAVFVQFVKQCCTPDVTVWFVFFLTGGTYYLDINIPDSYPFNPPKVGPAEEELMLEGEYIEPYQLLPISYTDF